VKYILAILLSVSIYSPDIARLVAYTDYVLDVVSEEKLNICDCEGILQKDTPVGHKEHNMVLTTHFTCVLTEVFSLPEPVSAHDQEFNGEIDLLLPRFTYDIFQPPRV
jgi:hypothetical protein